MRNSSVLGRLTGAAILTVGSAVCGQPTSGPAPAPQGPIGTILVLPFHEAAGTNMSWLGRALQQDLVVDLSRSTHARVEGPSAAAEAADSAGAISAGRSAGASLVVYGQFQSSQGRLRLTGQIVDVTTGKPGGSVVATGPDNDLFPLEDDVAEQILRSLPPGWLSVKLRPAQNEQVGSAGGMTSVPTPPTTMPQENAMQQLAAPLNPPQTEYYSYNYPDYATAHYYAAPYYSYDPYPYWYGYPYFGPDIYLYGGWGYGHYYHHGWYGGRYGYHGGYGYGHGGEFRGGGGFHGGGFHGGGGRR